MLRGIPFARSSSGLPVVPAEELAEAAARVPWSRAKATQRARRSLSGISDDPCPGSPMKLVSPNPVRPSSPM
jgi:hypothetical protein